MPYTPEQAREYYLRNKERIKARVAEYRKNNPEKAKAAVLAWYARPENKAKRNEYFKTYSKTDPFINAQQKYLGRPGVRGKKRDYAKTWREQNPDKNCHKTNTRRVAKLQRIPVWQTALDRWLFEEIYELAALRSKVTGVPYEVDHIIPLQGKLVSGLHTHQLICKLSLQKTTRRKVVST